MCVCVSLNNRTYKPLCVGGSKGTAGQNILYYPLHRAISRAISEIAIDLIMVTCGIGITITYTLHYLFPRLHLTAKHPNITIKVPFGLGSLVVLYFIIDP